MIDSRDHSYYEIALTNRQVIGIFTVLLACVVVAFFSGVWIGRGASGPQVATVEPQAIEAGGEPGGEPLEELEFFRREQSPVAAPQPQAESAERQRAGQSGEPQKAEVERPVIIEEIEQTATEPQRAEVPAVTPPPVPQRSAPDQAIGEPLPLVVQVFSTTDERQARQVLERLRASGYPVGLSPVDVDGRPMYRVRVGPYSERAEAQRVADRVRRDFKLDTWITR